MGDYAIWLRIACTPNKPKMIKRGPHTRSNTGFYWTIYDFATSTRPYALRFALCALRFTHYALRFTLYALHFALCALRYDSRVANYGVQCTVYSVRFTV